MKLRALVPVMLVVVTLAAPAAAGPTATYLLARRGSNKCLDVAGGGASDGQAILQWSCHGAANQTFRLDPLGGGRVRLIDQSAHKCVDVAGSGTADGTPIHLWTCNDTAAQVFAVEPLAGGYQRLRNPNSGKCVDVDRSSGADGARVQLWTCNGSDAQSWRIAAHGSDAGDPGQMVASQVGTVLTFSTGNVRVEYDLATGTADFIHGGVRRLTGFYAGVDLDRYITSRDYAQRTYQVSSNQVVVTSTGNGLPAMQQVFDLTGGHRFLARVVVVGRELSTRWIAPVVVSTAGGVDIGSTDDPRFLIVPFDNDAWVTYDAARLADRPTGTSFEAAAFYDGASRNGLVVGSVLHDTWKTGVYYRGAGHRLDALNVFGGVTDPASTRDVVPHTKVTGDTVYSPLVFVGYGQDWRDLLEEFADVNGFYVNPLPWAGGVPFGWNSWGKIQHTLTYDKAIAVSDFIHQLQWNDFHSDGTVYVNLDSYWDNLSDAQLAAFVARCRANGQKAGIYWAPFVDWGKWARPVEGAPATTYDRIWLRDERGDPIELDGAYAIDPTHPATQRRIDVFIDRLAALGFEYIKLDFLTHGALESTVRHSPTARTGIQAYNEGMRYLRARIGDRMFISASIAPLFPHQYAHARRVSCDTYGAARGFASSEYQLNSATYGWWLSGRLYRFNDPDYNVFEGFAPAENMTRLIATVVSGTVFLNGDDLTRPAAQQLARTYLTNPRINPVARLDRAERPVEGNTGTRAAELFVLRDGATTYLAAFNFSGGDVTRTIDLARAGLDRGRDYRVTDLWTNQSWTARDRVSLGLGKDYARLLKLAPASEASGQQ